MAVGLKQTALFAVHHWTATRGLNGLNGVPSNTIFDDIRNTSINSYTLLHDYINVACISRCVAKYISEFSLGLCHGLINTFHGSLWGVIIHPCHMVWRLKQRAIWFKSWICNCMVSCKCKSLFQIKYQFVQYLLTKETVWQRLTTLCVAGCPSFN